MTRSKKLMLNSVSALIHQIVTIICGFVLPRFFLSYYGSAVNGLVSSITQFLGIIALADCGVGAVMQSALYKPLADNDDKAISRIVVSSERFFRRVAYILAGYVFVLAVCYPFITLKSFDYLFTVTLIIAISISTFAQYYLGITYRLILVADQLGFLQYTLHIATLILNTAGCIILMKCGASIQTVKLTTSCIFLLQPLILSYIAKRRYKIDRSVEITEEPIKQKWNGLYQHIATVMLENTDTLVLTVFSTLENVSVYAVYHLVVNGLKTVVVSVTNGMRAMLGNIMARGENDLLITAFDNIEWLIHTVVTFVFSVTAVLILPFVSVYTAKVRDANYIVPTFAYLITAAQASYSLRLPYNIVILAAGHFKETQWSAVTEAGMNVVLSIVLVSRFGLVGVAIGTLAAMTYRTCYFVWYLSKNILYRKISFFLKHIFADAVSAAAIILFTKLFPDFFALQSKSFAGWGVLAVKTGILGLLIVAVTNLLFYRKKLVNYLKKFSRT